MCNCEIFNTQLIANMKERGDLLKQYEENFLKKMVLDKEIDQLNDEVNMVKWKTAQNVAVEKNDDGKSKYTNQEQRDIAVELSLRVNDGYLELQKNVDLKLAELNNCKANLEFSKLRLKNASENLEILKIWRQ